ncbi:MAG: hypothetical protein KC416_13820 [Myxococcales bacterium]|nr:hypothetical protein [Myxococcales bacterium]
MCLGIGCSTVDLGDNFIAPERELDEDFFFCRIQPEVLAAQSCASGADGEGGSCHSARSSLRLSVDGETDAPPPCDDSRVTGDVPSSYRDNLEAVRFTVGTDALSSPLYRRAVGLDSHPRVIFAEDSAEAQLVAEWITRGGS